jgi:hypothetical protein
VALNVGGRQIPGKRYNPTLKTQVIFAVIWDSITVRERCIKTKEIPSPERNTLKQTHVATGNRIYFDFYTLDGVFTAGLFKSFDVTHSYGRT